MSEVRYMSGFGSYYSTEALPGALPKGQNSPQRAPYGLYPEQLSGSAFTALRHENERSWLYRIKPSVDQGEFRPVDHPHIQIIPHHSMRVSPSQMRWQPLPIPTQPTDFIQGWVKMTFSGQPGVDGCSVYHYQCNQSMTDKFVYDSDGELLVVLQEGTMRFRTEMGVIEASPLEIVVIPRGVKFQVELMDGQARGYICENYGASFTLPQLGPIGANGLANARDFAVPEAQYEEKTGEFRLQTIFQGHLWEAPIDHSPLDVVAWHGTLAPYKYDLRNFNTVNTVSFDHPDPSIFTVLTSPSARVGWANIDFAIFPPRWMVAENTFRPPYYHRNVMSEYMGLIEGAYDAKQGGFTPGGASLHNCMSSHGPDAETFESASHVDLKPERYKDTMAFMFETQKVFVPTDFALECPQRDKDYLQCWKGLKSHFDPNQI